MTVTFTNEQLAALWKRLSGLATLRQHAVNTMPAWLMGPSRAKAVADIGTLMESVAAISELIAARAEIKRLGEQIARDDEIDGIRQNELDALQAKLDKVRAGMRRVEAMMDADYTVSFNMLFNSLTAILEEP